MNMNTFTPIVEKQLFFLKFWSRFGLLVNYMGKTAKSGQNYCVRDLYLI